MNAVTLSAQVATPSNLAGGMGQAVAGEKVSFENVLMGMTSKATKGEVTTDNTTSEVPKAEDATGIELTGEMAKINTIADCSVEKATDIDINKLFEEIFSMLQGNFSVQDIEKKLESLSTEQTNQLIEIANKLISIISDKLSSKETVINQIVNQLVDEKDNSDVKTAMLSQVFEMLGIDPKISMQSKVATTSDISSLAKVSEVIVSNLSKISQAEKIVNIDNNAKDLTQSQNNMSSSKGMEFSLENQAKSKVSIETTSFVNVQTGEIAKSTENQQLESLQTSTKQLQATDFSKVNSILEKLVNVAEGKANAEVKVVSNTISDGEKAIDGQGEKLASKSPLNITGTNLVDVKKTQQASEFEEILAYAQTGKTIEQPAVQEDLSTQSLGTSVEKQIFSEISNQISTNEITPKTKEMTLTLKPQELGEVSIKLEKVGEEIKVSIIAQNISTQKLITERLPSLISTLQEINSQVKDVMIVNPNQNANGFMSGFNNSNSNAGEQYQSRQSGSNYNNNEYVSEESQKTKEFVREGKLWQTA